MWNFSVSTKWLLQYIFQTPIRQCLKLKIIALSWPLTTNIVVSVAEQQQLPELACKRVCREWPALGWQDILLCKDVFFFTYVGGVFSPYPICPCPLKMLMWDNFFLLTRDDFGGWRPFFVLTSLFSYVVLFSPRSNLVTLYYFIQHSIIDEGTSERFSPLIVRFSPRLLGDF